MDLLSLIIIAIGLSLDSFAVSVSCGLVVKNIKFSQAVRFSLPLAIFQGLMPVLGWFAGFYIKDYIKEIDHWIAFILLAAVGIKMIIESRKLECDKNINPLNIWVNFTLAIATSIDALIIGFSFALFEVNILLAIVVIAIITFLVAMLGLFWGRKASKKFGQKMELIGGIILLSIGLKILLEHLFF